MKISPPWARIVILAFCIAAMRVWGGQPIETLTGGQPMNAQRGSVLLLLVVVLLIIVATLHTFRK